MSERIAHLEKELEEMTEIVTRFLFVADRWHDDDYGLWCIGCNSDCAEGHSDDCVLIAMEEFMERRTDARELPKLQNCSKRLP